VRYGPFPRLPVADVRPAVCVKTQEEVVDFLRMIPSLGPSEVFPVHRIRLPPRHTNHLRYWNWAAFYTGLSAQTRQQPLASQNLDRARHQLKMFPSWA
jgi:hypothetical protein